MATSARLQAALDLFMSDGVLDPLETDALIGMIMQDQRVTEAEKTFLLEVLRQGALNADARAALRDFLQTFAQRANVWR
jgi:hypothetical protein